jgi:hypothetical protein
MNRYDAAGAVLSAAKIDTRDERAGTPDLVWTAIEADGADVVRAIADFIVKHPADEYFAYVARSREDADVVVEVEVEVGWE